MTDKTQQAVQALERVEKYLKRKKVSRMIDPEVIHNLDDKYDLRVSDLNTMIEALRSSQWRDISTAPRDGTEILLTLQSTIRPQSLAGVTWVVLTDGTPERLHFTAPKP